MRRADTLLVVLRALVIAAGLGFAVPARADDLSEFEAARALYDQQNYARAVDAFRLLVGTDPPRLTDPLLVLESRKYLGASLLFMGAATDAKMQFRLLLQQEPDYTLDPLAFPTEVVNLFEQVKVEARDLLEEQRRLREEEKQKAEEKARARDRLRLTNLARLRDLASESEVRIQNSRWIATIPFGVGQFQNGDRGLGVALGMAEGLSAVTSVVSFIAHQQLRDDNPSLASVEEAERIEAAWRTTNIVSFSIFIALALVGIIDAHVRFVPERVTSRPRPLPPDLERWVREQGLSLRREQGFSQGVPVLRF